MGDLIDALRSLPPITGHWFGGTVALSLVARFGIIPYSYLVLGYPEIFQKFQIWRFMSALFYYPMIFKILPNLFHLVTYSKLLEKGVFITRPADYALMLLFNWVFCILGALIMNLSVLMDAMVMTVLYTWCNLNRDLTVNWLGINLRALYLPWILFVFSWIVQGGGMGELVGIVVGHLYFFLKWEYPEKYGGPSLLNTPTILETCFPQRRVIMGVGGQLDGRARAIVQPNAGAGGHNWGRGNVLGNSG